MLGNDNPLVSVIVPAYNHQNYVQETLKSIINQTYQNIELIVIDDGSKDATWQKICELKNVCENRFNGVYFAAKKNEGTCKTFNKLISLTKGDYIYIIASDDVAKPQAIEKLLQAIEPVDAVLAVGNNEFIDAAGKRIGWDKKQNSVPLTKAKYKTFAEQLKISAKKDNFGTYRELLKSNHIPNGYLIKAAALRKIRFTPEAPLEDYFMNLQLAKIGKFVFVDEILLSYRWHAANTIKQTAKMLAFQMQTLRYEEKLTAVLPDKKWNTIFKEEKYKTKNIFSLGNFIKYYKTKDLSKKQKILEIFGKKIVLKSKTFQY